MQNDPVPQQASPLTKQTLPAPHSALLVHGSSVQVGIMHASVPSVVWLHRQPLPAEPHGVKASQVHSATHWPFPPHTWSDGQQAKPVGLPQTLLISPLHLLHACWHEPRAAPGGVLKLQKTAHSRPRP